MSRYYTDKLSSLGISCYKRESLYISIIKKSYRLLSNTVFVNGVSILGVVISTVMVF